MPKQKPSQVVLVRRILDQVVDDIADDIAKRRSKKRRHRTFIAVYGDVLSLLYDLLIDVQSLQHGHHRTIPPELKEKILELETESTFKRATFKEHYKELVELLNKPTTN